MSDKISTSDYHKNNHNLPEKLSSRAAAVNIFFVAFVLLMLISVASFAADVNIRRLVCA